MLQGRPRRMTSIYVVEAESANSNARRVMGLSRRSLKIEPFGGKVWVGILDWQPVATSLQAYSIDMIHE